MAALFFLALLPHICVKWQQLAMFFQDVSDFKHKIKMRQILSVQFQNVSDFKCEISKFGRF